MAMTNIPEKFALSGGKAVKPKVAVGIVGVGSYLPPTVLKNEDFIYLQLSEEQKQLITNYYGFKERRYAKEESFSDMSVKAAKNALNEYSIDPGEIDLVISTHCSRDMARLSPPNSNYIQTAIGADNATSFNVDGGFNGMLNAVVTASAFIGSGFYDTVLVVSGETAIRELDCTNMLALFMGDGAGALVLKRLKDNEEGLLAFHLMAKECEKAAGVKVFGAYGNFDNPHFEIRPYVSVEPESFERDVPFLENYIPYSIEQSLATAGLTALDVDLFVFGQQYKALNMTWAEKLGIPYDRVHDTIEKHACFKNPNIPVITHDAIQAGKLKKGDIVVFGDQGANWSISSAVFRWCI
jgi:3-oxoacyl-[acyl-carrier-protein] synthase-3